MKIGFRAYTAAFLLIAGVSLSVAGFCVPPVGEISDSVLWFFAQCLIYAGSALGIDVLIDHKVSRIKEGR
jgi:hypothetical protein